MTTVPRWLVVMGATGLELPKESTGKTAISSAGGAECGALSHDSDPETAPPAPTDPDLASVIAAWPTLPGPVRAGIVAMVEAAVISD